MLAALSVRPRVIGFFDADLSTPLQAVDDFLAVLRRDRRSSSFSARA